MKQKQFEPLVYWTSKLSHKRHNSYKQFEHCGRRMHKHSLLNLVQTVIPTDTRTLTKLNHAKPFTMSKISVLFGYPKFFIKKNRYSQLQNRISNTHCPSSASPEQSLAAFDHFLDYLRRTATRFCLEKGTWRNRQGLHFHIMLNNFIRIYIR